MYNDIMEKYSPDKEHIVMTRSQVRSFDSWVINTVGLPGAVLMENAGRSCAELIKDKLADIEKPKVCIFCGTGNNGGDGYVIGRHLLNCGFVVRVVICGDPDKIKSDAKINLDVLKAMGQPIERLNLKTEDIAAKVQSLAAGCNMLVDAVFGTGLTGRVHDEHVTLIDSINQQGHSILAVDIPSGLDCDTGQPLGAVIRADVTVTFVAVKKGFTCEDAAQYTGKVFVASIGIEPHTNPAGQNNNQEH